MVNFSFAENFARRHLFYLDMLGKNNKLGGHIIQLVKPSYEYICSMCYFGLRTPFQTSCGHRFCEYCIKHIIMCGPKMCPEDKTRLTIESIFPDVFCKRRILELECFCSRKDRGCSWTGPTKLLEDHLSLCPKSPLSCPKGCEKIVDRSKMVQHLSHDCPNADGCCPMAGLCDYKGSKAEVHNHLAEKNVEHASMVEDKIFSIEMVQNTMQEERQVLKNQVTNLRKELVSVRNDVATLFARLDGHLNTGDVQVPLKEESGKEELSK